MIEGEDREGVGSWMWATRALMWRRGLGREWDEPELCCHVSKDDWKERDMRELRNAMKGEGGRRWEE